jgi:hypothetical protein
MCVGERAALTRCSVWVAVCNADSGKGEVTEPSGKKNKHRGSGLADPELRETFDQPLDEKSNSTPFVAPPRSGK